MKIVKGVLTGGIFGFLSSFIISFLFMLIGQQLAGGITSFFGESWLYYATIFPFVVTFGYLGFFFTKNKQVSNKNLWFISLFSAMFISLYSGTVGSLFGEWVVRGGRLRIYTEDGYTGVNVEGVLFAGAIYAFILLPITIPFMRLIINIFRGTLRELKIL